MVVSEKTQIKLNKLLTDDPFLSYTELANALNLSKPTAKKYVSSLVENGALAANLNENKLGLSNSYYFLKTDNISNVNTNKVLDFGLIHPYTQFISKSTGYNGFFVQLRTPPGAEPIYRDLMYEFGDFLEGADIIELQGEIKELVYQRYDIERGTYKSVTKAYEDQIEVQSDFDIQVDSSLRHELTLRDIIILRELEMKPKQKIIELVKSVQSQKYYNRTEKKLFKYNKRKVISDRIQYIRKNKIFRNFYLDIRPGLENSLSIMVLGKLKEKTKTKFMNFLKFTYLNNRFLKVFNNNFSIFWFLVTLQDHSQMTNIISEVFDNPKFLYLTRGSSGSVRYPIWHRNFIDLDNRNFWRKEESWLKDKPLEQLYLKYANSFTIERPKIKISDE